MSAPRHFFIKAIWDDEAQVFYSESDIKGLHIEAETLAEFEAVLEAFWCRLCLSQSAVSIVRMSE